VEKATQEELYDLYCSPNIQVIKLKNIYIYLDGECDMYGRQERCSCRCAVIFLLPSMEPIHQQIMSSSPRCLAAFIMMLLEVL